VSIVGGMNTKNSAKKIGHGEFGDIYSGVKGDAAIQLLLRLKAGEVRGAFVRSDIGGIDLISDENGQKSVVGLCYKDKSKIWLVTSYIPIK